MSDVIRINNTMRTYLDKYKKAVLLDCEEHWNDDDIVYKNIYNSVSNMSDQELIIKALCDQYSYYKYVENLKGLQD